MSMLADGGAASIREVQAMVEGIRRELLAEIGQLDATLDARFDAHRSQHKAEEQTHHQLHRREHDQRAGLFRWGVTTLMTGVGTLFAIVWAVSHGA